MTCTCSMFRRSFLGKLVRKFSKMRVKNCIFMINETVTFYQISRIQLYTELRSFYKIWFHNKVKRSKNYLILLTRVSIFVSFRDCIWKFFYQFGNRWKILLSKGSDTDWNNFGVIILCVVLKAFFGALSSSICK